MSKQEEQTSLLSNVDRLLSDHVQGKSEAAQSRLFSKLSRKEVAAQIRQLREKRGLTQIKFARLCKMKQSAVSRIEQSDYSGWNYKTLARIAEKLHARLRITFEPLEDVVAKMDAASETGSVPFDVPQHEAVNVAPLDRGGLPLEQSFQPAKPQAERSVLEEVFRQFLGFAGPHPQARWMAERGFPYGSENNHTGSGNAVPEAERPLWLLASRGEGTTGKVSLHAATQRSRTTDT